MLPHFSLTVLHSRLSSFAFVDFASIEYATSALINPKNHHLDGRDLKVEYASANAVSRGASKPKLPDQGASTVAPRDQKAKYSKSTRPSGRPEGGFRSQTSRPVVESAERPSAPTKSQDLPTPSQDHDESRPVYKTKGPKSRPKPGAALAMAKRQSAAILPSSGPSKKITF